MVSRSLLAALALGAGLAAAPAMAATPPSQPGKPDSGSTATSKSISSNEGGPAHTSSQGSATADKSPSKLNPLLTDKGKVRMSKLIGSEIYNDQDKKLGSVADIVAGPGGKPTVIVKIDGKLYPVAWSKLRFGDAEKSGDNKVLIPGMQKKTLTAKPQFHYTSNSSKG